MGGVILNYLRCYEKDADALAKLRAAGYANRIIGALSLALTRPLSKLHGHILLVARLFPTPRHMGDALIFSAAALIALTGVPLGYSAHSPLTSCSFAVTLIALSFILYKSDTPRGILAFYRLPTVHSSISSVFVFGDTRHGGHRLCMRALLGVFFALVISVLPDSALLFLAVAVLSVRLLSPLVCLTFALGLPVLYTLGHPSALVSLFVLFAFLMMLAFGKRSIITPLDIAVGYLCLLYLISGALGGGLSSAILTVMAVSGYFISSRLVRGARMARTVNDLFVLVSAIHATGALFDFFLFPTVREEWLDPEVSGSFARIVGSFSNPNIFAVYLIFALMLSLSGALAARGLRRIFFTAAVLLNLACMLFTYTRGAYIAIILGALLFAALTKRRLLRIGAVLAPLGVSIGLLGGFLGRLATSFSTADGSISSRLSIWRSSLLMLRDNLITGIGVGEGRFTEAFSAYAEGGVFAPHSHNLFLQLALEGGIFALFAFLYILLCVLRITVSFGRRRSPDECGYIAYGSVSALFSAAIFGLTDNILYSLPMAFLFFSYLGIATSLMREDTSRIGQI